MNERINHVRKGNELTVVVINGFLSESNNDVSDWLKVIDKKYPNASIVQLDWAASNISQALNRFGKQELISLLAKTAMMSVPVLGAPIMLLNARTLIQVRGIVKQWKNSVNNTIPAGMYLAKYIDENPGEYIIMGHSLGARVTYHALSNMNKIHRITNAFLFGGAISHEEKWSEIVSKNKNLLLTNSYSKNDDVLKYLYRAGTGLKDTPIGLTEIKSSNSNQIINIDLSHIVNGHMKYKEDNVGQAIS